MPRLRSALSIALSIAVVVALGASPATAQGDGNDPKAKPPKGVDFVARTTALARTATPGSQVAYIVTVLDQGTDAARGATVVTVDGLAGTTLVGAGPAPAPNAPGWQCSPGGGGLRCELDAVTAGGTSPAPLTPGLPAQMVVTTQVGSQATGRTGITVRTDVAGDVTRGNDDDRATTRVAGSASPPTSLYPDVSLPASLRPGEQTTADVQLIVGGPSPAAGVTLSSLLPPGLATSWSSTGRSWACRDAGDGTPTCTLAGALAVGQPAPPLSISFTTAADAHDVSWVTRVAATSAGQDVEASEPQRVAVAPLTSNLAVVAQFAGSPQARSGETRQLAVTITNASQTAPPGPVNARIRLPAGVELTAATGAFACPVTTGQRTVTCRRTAAQPFVPGAQTSFTATLRVTDAAEPGTRPIEVQASAPGRTAKTRGVGRVKNRLVPGRTVTPLFVLPPPAAKLTATWWRVGRDGAPPVEVVDGAPAVATAGQSYRYELQVANIGSADLPAGTTVQLAQRFGSGVEVRTAGAAPGDAAAWRCSTGTRLRCALHLANALAPDEVVGRVRVTVDTSRATPHDRWPVRVTARGVHTAVQSLPMPVTVQKPRHGLVTSLATAQSPTAGGRASLTLTVRNEGGEAARHVRARVTLPGARARDEPTPRWDCKADGDALACRSSTTLEPGALLTLPASFAVPTGVGRRIAARADATSETVGTDAESRLRLSVLPPLTATATAVPDTVVTGIRGRRADATSVLLDAHRVKGGGVHASYAWRQLCTTPAEARRRPCGGRVAPAVSWPDGPGGAPPAGPRVRALVPDVGEPTALRFELTVTDGSARASSVVTVEARPPASERYVFSKRHQSRSARGGGPRGSASSRAPADLELVAARHRATIPRQAQPPVQPTGPTTTATTTPPPSPPAPLTPLTPIAPPVPGNGVSVNPNLYLPEPITVDPGATVSLTGAATGVAPISYQWSQVSGPGVLTPGVVTDQPELQFTAPDTAGTIVLALTATDSRGEQGSGQVDVTVGQPSTATTADAGGDVTVAPGGTVTLKGSGTGDAPLTYSWSQLSGPDVLGGVATNEATLTFRAPAQPTTLAFRLTVTAADGSTAGDTVTVTIGGTGGTASLLCQLLQQVGRGGAGPFAFSPAPGLSFSLRQVTVTGGTTCAQSPTISFKSGSASLFNLFAVTGLNGSATTSGLTISSGTLSLPSSWGSFTLTIDGGPDGQGLFLPFTSTGAGSLAGSVTGHGLPFVPLPRGWAVTTRLSFASAVDGQSIALGALAGGPNAARLTLGGSIGTNGALSISASAQGLVQLGSNPLDISGSITTTGKTSPAFAITGTLEKPVTIASGVTLQTLDATIAGSSVTGSGSVQLGTGNPTTVHVSLDYLSRSAWSIVVSAATAPWTPVPGLTIPASGISGSVKANGTDLVVDVSVQLPQSWTPVPAVTVSGLEGSLTVTCPLSGGGRCDPQLKASGSVAVSVGTSATADVSASLDLATGKFSGTAKFTGTIGLVSRLALDGASLTVAYEPGGEGLTVSADASLVVLGQAVDVQADFSTQGVLVAGDVGSWGPAKGDPLLTGAAAVFSTYQTTYTPPGGTAVVVPADGLVLAGSFVVPSWFNKLIGGSSGARVTGSATIDPATDSFELQASINAPSGGWHLANMGKVSILLDSVGFDIDAKGGQVTVGLDGDATLQLPASSNGSVGPTDLDVTLAASFNPEKESLTGDIELADPNGWQNAFGVSGLTLFDAVFQIGVDFETVIPTPSLGLAAKASLPESVVSPLGIPPNTPITVVADFDLESPCFGLQIGQQGGPTVLNIANENVLTASYANIQIAPTGCTVGSYTYQPGFSLDFDGAILGTTVDVNATLSLTPFVLDATVKIGQFHVGGLTIGQSSLGLDIAPAQNTFKLSFSGSIALFGDQLDISGGFSEENGTTTADFTAVVKGGFHLGPLEVTQDPTVSVAVTIPTDKPPSVAVQAAGGISVLGTTASATLDLDIVDGDVETADGTVTVRSPLGPVTLAGNVTIDYSQSAGLDMSFAGSVSTAAGNIASATGSVTPNATQLTGSFTVGSALSATVSGAVVYGTGGAQIPNQSGQLVDANKGDFSFSANPVELSLGGGFQAQGSIGFGSIGSDKWADVTASVTISDSVTNDAVSVTGDFSGDGSYSFDGTADVNFLGFTTDFSLDVSAGVGGSDPTVSGSGKVSVLDNTLSFSGDFSRANGQTLYTLDADASVSFSGYSLGQLHFVLSNQPGTAGLSAAANVNLGPASFNGTLVVHPPPSGSGDDLIYLSGNGRVSVPVITVNGSFTLTNCTTSACTASGPVALSFGASGSFGGPVTFSVSGNINSNGQFNFGANAAYSTSGGVNLLLAKFQAASTITLGLSFSSSSPYVSFSTNDSMEIQAKFWEVVKWSGWKNLFAIHVGLQTSPFKAFLDFHVGTPINANIDINLH